MKPKNNEVIAENIFKAFKKKKYEIGIVNYYYDNTDFDVEFIKLLLIAKGLLVQDLDRIIFSFISLN